MGWLCHWFYSAKPGTYFLWFENVLQLLKSLNTPREVCHIGKLGRKIPIGRLNKVYCIENGAMRIALKIATSEICNISNTRKSVSSWYPNTEKWVGKTRRSRVFLTVFEEFGYLMKHSFEFLIWLLKPFIILGEIQTTSSQNFMLIKIRYPNHRHGSDFLCFLFMNY